METIERQFEWRGKQTLRRLVDKFFCELYNNESTLAIWKLYTYYTNSMVVSGTIFAFNPRQESFPEGLPEEIK